MIRRMDAPSPGSGRRCARGGTGRRWVRLRPCDSPTGARRGRQGTAAALPDAVPRRGAVRVQAHLGVRGFPAPAVLGSPAPIGRGIAGAEVLVDDPGASVPLPGARAASAASLARLVRLRVRAAGSRCRCARAAPARRDRTRRVVTRNRTARSSTSPSTPRRRATSTRSPREAVRVRALDDTAPGGRAHRLRGAQRPFRAWWCGRRVRLGQPGDRARVGGGRAGRGHLERAR